MPGAYPSDHHLLLLLLSSPYYIIKVDQAILTLNTPTTLIVSTTTFDFSIPLPFNYSSSYTRHVVLAGFDMSVSSKIDFTMITKSFTIDSTAEIQITYTHTAMTFTRISVFVVLVVINDYIWAITDSTYIATQLTIHFS